MDFKPYLVGAVVVVLIVVAFLGERKQRREAIRRFDENRGRDGATPETAIIVESIGEEYDWMRTTYPGFEPAGQSLCEVGGKPYDVLTWRNAQGDERVVSFDISRFFGRLF